MLDEDLAGLYRVQTRELVQAVKRNAVRFPGDFMFRLSSLEVVNLRSQIVISSQVHGGRRGAPLAFTEQGVAMLSSVLRSPRAIEVNIEIMRAFVRLRRLLLENVDLARKLDALEQKYDGQFRVVFEAIRELMRPAEEPTRRIGFGREGADSSSHAGRLLALVLLLQCARAAPVLPLRQEELRDDAGALRTLRVGLERERLPVGGVGLLQPAELIVDAGEGPRVDGVVRRRLHRLLRREATPVVAA
jgi:hypothetical protein